MRSLGFVVLAIPLMFGLAACAGTTDPQAELAAGYSDAELGQNSVAGEPIEASWPILSYEDREAIGRVTYAEAGNQGAEGIAAVIFTILNRVNSGRFGSSVQDVIDAPNQFEPATRAGGWRYLPRLDPWQSVQFETILNLILAGRLPDLTAGALFFQNARIVAARAARGAVSSYLVDFGGTPPVAEIGDHRFYDWRAGVNLASRRHRTQHAETVYPADEIEDAGGIEDAGRSDEAIATWVDSEETSPQPEPFDGSPWDEQQAIPSPSSDVLAFEPVDAGQCTVGAYC
jgi:hypothetical protein